MKIKYLFLTASTLLMTACNNGEKSNSDTTTDSISQEEIALSTTDEEREEQDEESKGADQNSLNDIRFKNWENKDWLDNDYIRAVRTYLNDYGKGKFQDKALEPFKEEIKSKFLIGAIEPALLGGVSMRIIFFDMLDRAFNIWVYSDVNEQTEKVSNYEVRAIFLEEEKINLTQEQLLEEVKERPEFKFW